MADPGFANGGAKVERRRREDRGAEGAEGGGGWGRDGQLNLAHDPETKKIKKN